VYHEGQEEKQLDEDSSDCRVITLMQKVEMLETVLTENCAKDLEHICADDFVKLESSVDDLNRRADEMDAFVKSMDANHAPPSQGVNALAPLTMNPSEYGPIQQQQINLVTEQVGRLSKEMSRLIRTVAYMEKADIEQKRLVSQLTKQNVALRHANALAMSSRNQQEERFDGEMRVLERGSHDTKRGGLVTENVNEKGMNKEVKKLSTKPSAMPKEAFKMTQEMDGSLVLGTVRKNTRSLVPLAAANSLPHSQIQIPDASELHIDQQQLDEITEMFETWDSDGSGIISLSELKQCMGAGGFSESELESMFCKFDEDGNGELDKGEFVRAMVNACYVEQTH
jgi:hypothetical protein